MAFPHCRIHTLTHSVSSCDFHRWHIHWTIRIYHSPGGMLWCHSSTEVSTTWIWKVLSLPDITSDVWCCNACLFTSSLPHNDICNIYKLLQTWGVTFFTSIGSCLLSCWSWEWAHPAASHQWWACDRWHIFFWCHTSILHFASLATHQTLLLQIALWMTW